MFYGLRGKYRCKHINIYICIFNERQDIAVLSALQDIFQYQYQSIQQYTQLVLAALTHFIITARLSCFSTRFNSFFNQSKNVLYGHSSHGSTMRISFTINNGVTELISLTIILY